MIATPTIGLDRIWNGWDMKFDEEHFARQEQALRFLAIAREHLLERDGVAWLDQRQAVQVQQREDLVHLGGTPDVGEEGSNCGTWRAGRSLRRRGGRSLEVSRSRSRRPKSPPGAFGPSHC